MSSITISTNVNAASGTQTAPEDAGHIPGDDLTILSGVTVTVSEDDLTLRAGDNVVIDGTVNVVATGKTLSITAGYQDNDNAGAITLGATGSLTATNATLAALTGMTLSGTISVATLDLTTLGGGISQNSPGAITANRLQSSGGVVGNAAIGGSNHIAELGNFTASNLFGLADDSYLTIDGAVSAASIQIIDGIGIETSAASTLSAGSISFASDQLALELGTMAATGEIALAPTTSGAAVALGDGVSATFALSQAELDNLSAPTLTIGQHTGLFTTAGSITIGNAAVSSSTLNLYSLGGVIDITGVLTVGDGSGTLNVAAGGTVRFGFTLDGSSGVQVGAIGGSTTGGDFVVNTAGVSGPLTVNAITTSGGEIVLESYGNGDITVAGALTSHGGNIFVGDVDGTNALALNLNADIDAGTGSIGLIPGSGITQTAGKLVGTDLVVNGYFQPTGGISLTSATNAISGHVAIAAGPTGDISFTNSFAYEIGGIAAINYSSIGGSVNPTLLGAIQTGANAAVTLTAGGNITQSGNTDDKVSTGTLNLAHLAGASSDVTLDNTHNTIHKLGTIDLDLGALTLTDSIALTATGHLVAESFTLTAPSVTFAASSTLAVAVGDIDPRGEVHVHGTVAIDGAGLELSILNGPGLAAGQHYVIIDNDGTDAVAGTFAGLAEGASFGLGDVAVSISYHGGDGNDVVLTALANHAPVNTVPPDQSVLHDTDLSIGGLSVADQDAGEGTMTTTLGVDHGTLTLATGGIEMSGNGSGSVSLFGTLAQIDATLASLVYHPDAGFIGADTLTMTTSDNGNTGLPGPLTDTDTVKINVTASPQQGPQPIIGTPGDDTFTAAPGAQEYIGLRGVDTMVFDFKLVDAQVTYSGNQIIIDGPNGSHTVMSGIETFVFTDGTVNTRDGSNLIDDLFYYSRNHDVWNAHMDADTHFNLYGWKEGRDPNAWFDTKGYLAHYTDVAAAGVNPLTHYDQYGWHEGRDPSTQFDTKAYLANYPDVVAKGFDPLAHFMTWQSEEGRHAFGDGVWA
jgi:hypothetical protein